MDPVLAMLFGPVPKLFLKDVAQLHSGDRMRAELPVFTGIFMQELKKLQT